MLQVRLWMLMLYNRTGKIKNISTTDLYKELIEEMEAGEYSSTMLLGVLADAELLGESEQASEIDYYRLGASQHCAYSLMILTLIGLFEKNKQAYMHWKQQLQGIHDETVLLHILKFARDPEYSDFISGDEFVDSLEQLITLRVKSAEDELLYVYNYGFDGLISPDHHKLSEWCVRLKDHNQRARTFYAELCLRHSMYREAGLEDLHTLAYEENYQDAKDALFLHYRSIDSWMDYPEYVEEMFRYCRENVENPGTQYVIATLFYSEGKAIKLDLPRSQHWLEKSANAGFGRACYELGECYAKGLGGYVQDLNLAEMYTQKALDDGIEEAKKVMDFIHFVK